MLSTQEILRFITEDKESEKKLMARKGVAYYEGRHDIENYKVYFYNADGNLVEDENRSNIKISHPFFTELVDQATQYVLSGDDIFKS
ncbi:MAG: phage portal protein, partial [Holdemanella sp.]|nr:phage portal protein [Holdemanella sp.]